MLTNASRLTESPWHAHEQAAPLLRAGAGTELRASSEEWSSTAFRRLGKTPNFFRTYSFSYMHHAWRFDPCELAPPGTGRPPPRAPRFEYGAPDDEFLDDTQPQLTE